MAERVNSSAAEAEERELSAFGGKKKKNRWQDHEDVR